MASSTMGSYVPPAMVEMTPSSIAAGVASNKLDEFTATEEETLQAEEKSNQRWTMISIGVASTAMVTALVAMWIEASAICYLAFAFPLVTSPFVIRQRHKLNKLPTFKQEINAIRVEVNQLIDENNRLSVQNLQLQERVKTLQNIEHEFESLAKRSGQDVNRMRQLANEHRAIQREMREVQKTHQIQQLLQAVLMSDRDGDFELSGEEMDLLLLRLKSIGGVRFDSQRMRTSLENSDQKSISSLFRVASEELQDDNGRSAMV